MLAGLLCSEVRGECPVLDAKRSLLGVLWGEGRDDGVAWLSSHSRAAAIRSSSSIADKALRSLVAGNRSTTLSLKLLLARVSSVLVGLQAFQPAGRAGDFTLALGLGAIRLTATCKPLYT